MNRFGWIAASCAALALISGIVAEDIGRRTMRNHWYQEVKQRQDLQKRYQKALASHDQLNQELTQERQHSEELSIALREARIKMEEAVARLDEENKAVRELQVRLTAMQRHMDQLQGELVVALQGREGAAAKDTAEMELDRIVVSQSGIAAMQGRVVSVHPDWNFVVVNLGWDSVKIGELISIVREDQLLAKARVERIQEGICAATILPEWKISNVQVNDSATVL